jgi:autotransporter-associated beta strand protein
MKNQHIARRDNISDLSANLSTGRFGRLVRMKAHAAMLNCAWMAVGILICLVTVPRVGAQVVAINNQITNNVERVRVTVPVNYSGVVVLTNLLRVYTNNLAIGDDGFYHIDPVNVTVTNLPIGATFSITDPNSVPLTTIAGDTNNYRTNLLINLTLNNVAEGVYTFYLVVTNATGTNDVPANKYPFVLQVAHIWNGSGAAGLSFNVSNNWANASSWQGGVPGVNDDVVFGDVGAQTNNTFDTGIAFTNVGIDTSTTIASLRFAQSVYTDGATTTNSLYHTIRIAPTAALSVTGTNGFSILRDYVDELADPGIDGRTLGVNFSGGGTLIVSNANANFGILVGSAGGSGGFASALLQPTLNMSNLNTFVSYVSRMGLAEYQLYPNYRELNNAYNAANDTNTYSGMPRRFLANVYFAKTNLITALYADPNNYTNEFTRGYGVSYLDNEQLGNGSANPTYFLLGLTNKINADGVCFVRASAATGNSGNFAFGAANSGAVFRGTNGGTSRMSVFTVSDDGGTNQAQGNIKATVNFAANNGVVDILADRLYIARDRTLITSNGTPNIQGDLYIGKGIVDANTAVLGFQEHSNKIDWTTLDGFAPYLNYCQGRLWITNGGTVRINTTLTLGYTADMNPETSAEQYNTFGQVTIYPSSTMTASNIVCDGGLNFYDSNGRQNSITINQGTLVVSNTLGAPAGLSAGDPRGLPLDTLSLSSGTVTLFVAPGKTNIYVRNLLCSGSTPSIIKIAQLNGVSTYPTNIPLIAYQSATPFLAADMSAIAGNVQGYLINNASDSTIDLFLTTNAPRSLLWQGGANNQWDLSSPNWVPVGGGSATAFALGDIVTFDDSSSVTNINITDVVVPNQSTNGVTITNSVRSYTFNAAGGAISGTARVFKLGTNSLTFNAAESGPIFLMGGAVNGSGNLGATTVGTNVTLNYSGNINGGLTSTGAVTLASGGTINGSVSIQGGWFLNSGTVNCGSAGTLLVGTLGLNNNEAVTNYGTINLGVASSEEFDGCTFANFGSINTPGTSSSARLYVRGLYFGNTPPGNSPAVGFIDASGGLSANSGRFNVRGGAPSSEGINAVVTPGATPNSIGAMNFQARLDLSESNPQNDAGTLLIKVDQAGHTNDTIYADKWNNIGCIIEMTNLNGAFSSGQSFAVFVNNNGSSWPNFVDTPGIFPLMSPTIPGPGLQWNLSAIQVWGTIMVTNSPLVWDGSGDGTWNTNGSLNNWKNGKVYGDNQGAIFDDSASGSTTITLTSPVAPAGFNTVIVTNIIVGVSTNIVTTTNTPSFMPGIIVSNALKDYTFIGTGTNRITGLTSIYKSGPGTLSLLASNDFIGGMVIDGGTVAFTNVLGLGVIASSGKSAYAQVVMNNCTLKNYGTTNQGYATPITIQQNGATFEVSSNTTIFTLSGGILGSGALTKTGPGTLALSSTANAFAGDAVVSTGTLLLLGASAGAGNIDLASGATLQLTNASSANNFTLTNGINAASGAVPINLLGSTALRLDGQLAGNATVTISSSNQFSFNGALTNFTGTLEFGNSSAHFRFNTSTNSNPCTGSAFATFDLGTSSATLSNLNGAGITYDLGALAGGANTILAGRLTNNPATNANTIYRIGANGSNTTFSGQIVDGADYTSAGGVPSPVAVVKVGNGTLFLNGANTYSGGTTVSNGILGGTGSLASALTVVSGGTLSPGAPIGTFTVNSTASLGGTVLMELNEASSPVNDMLVVSGTITATGALVVTNVGPDLYNHSIFKLFNKAVTGFAPVTLPAMDPSNTKTYTWNNNLSVDGTIQLVSGGTVNPNPTNITFNVTSGTLYMSWPADHTGWRLQAQTNSLSTGLGANWADVAGSTNVNSLAIPIDPNNGTVFYRLVYP